MAVEVIIEKDGTTRVEINGVCGPGCERFTDAIQRSLNADVVSEETKDAYYEEVVEAP